MLQNLLDDSIIFYRDTFEIRDGTIPVSATYDVTFQYETYFTVTALADEAFTIYLSGGGRSESFSFYSGDYVSSHKNIYTNIDDYSPVSNYNMEGYLFQLIL